MTHAPCFERRTDGVLVCVRPEVTLAWSSDDRTVALWSDSSWEAEGSARVEVISLEHAEAPGAAVLLDGEDHVRSVCFAGSSLLVLRDSATDEGPLAIVAEALGERTLCLHALPDGGAVATLRSAEISRAAKLRSTDDGSRILLSSRLRWSQHPGDRSLTRWFYVDRDLRVLATLGVTPLAEFFLATMAPRARTADWELDALLDPDGDTLLVSFSEDPTCGGGRWMARHDPLRDTTLRLDTAGFDEGATLPGGARRLIDLSHDGDTVRVTEVRDGATPRLVYTVGEVGGERRWLRWWTMCSALSPDGSKLVFITDDQTSIPEIRLHVLDLSRGEMLALLPGRSGACWIDDARLALAVRDDTGSLSLAVLSLDDGELRPWRALGVEVDEDTDVCLSRSPAGRWIEARIGLIEPKRVLLIPMLEE